MFGRKTGNTRSGPRLRVKAAALEGFRFTACNPFTVLRLVAIPALIIAAVEFGLSMPQLHNLIPKFSGFVADSGELVVTVLLVAVILVAWQRRILLGPGAARMRFGLRELRMIGAVLGIALVLALVHAAAVLVAIPVAMFGAVKVLMGIEGVAWVAMAYLTGRLYFALPPIAIDHGTTMHKAWRVSGAQALKLMVIVALISIPFEVLSYFSDVVSKIALQNGELAVRAGATLLKHFLFLLYIVVEAAALTFCYAALGGVKQIIEARSSEQYSADAPGAGAAPAAASA